MKTKISTYVLSLSTAFLSFTFQSFSCTTMVVTKGASADGSVFISHSDDNELQDERIVYVPAADHVAGTLRPVYYDGCSLGFKPEYGGTYSQRYVGSSRGPAYINTALPQSIPLGYIPQVEHTYAYFDGNYGIMNEHQLAIGECTCRANIQPEPQPGKRIFYSAELSRVALERCTTAREAIALMGDLIANYGYYGTGETLLVGDTEEGWVMEMCAYEENGTDGIWVARKVPDGDIFVEANEFRIREIDPDSDDFMYSDNLFEVAKEQGWWDPESGEKLDWLKSVSPGEYNHPYYSLRRVWRAFSKANPSLGLSPWVKDGYTKDYPFSIKPQEKLTVQDVMSLHRDHYEGTDFDMTKGPGAGPFGCPDRYASSNDSGGAGDFRKLKGAWERPLSVSYCGYMYINQCRSSLPDPIGGICWFAVDKPYESCLVPFYVGITDITDLYEQVDTAHFNWESAFWAFNLVSNWATLKYSYIIKDIQAVQSSIESREFGEQERVEAEALALYNVNPADASSYLSLYCNTNAEDVVLKWWTLAGTLIAKYSDGFISTPDNMWQDVGYPEWWKKEAGFRHGPKTYKKRRPWFNKFYPKEK